MNELRREVLRADLADLARESVPVDLREAVLQGSRRATVRRRVATAVAVTAITALAIGTLAAVLPGRRALPTHPTPTVTASPKVTASPLGYADPTLSAWTEKTGPSFPGTLYLAWLNPGQTTGTYRLDFSVLANGRLRTASLGDLSTDDCVNRSYALSPDGRYLAWIVGDPRGRVGQTLVVQPTDGGPATRYPAHAACSSGYGPYWQPDSRSVFVYDNERGPGTLNITTGAFTPYVAYGSPFSVWSANGAYRAYSDGLEIVVLDRNGQVVRQHAHPAGTGCCGGFSVRGVSNDGRLVGVGPSPSETSGSNWGFMTVFDVATGKDVKLPGPRIQAVEQVVFGPNGRLLLVTMGPNTTLTLYSAAGNQIAAAVFPGGPAVPGVLAYLP